MQKRKINSAASLPLGLARHVDVQRGEGKGDREKDPDVEQEEEDITRGYSGAVEPDICRMTAWWEEHSEAAKSQERRRAQESVHV